MVINTLPNQPSDVKSITNHSFNMLNNLQSQERELLHTPI